MPERDVFAEIKAEADEARARRKRIGADPECGDFALGEWRGLEAALRIIDPERYNREVRNAE